MTTPLGTLSIESSRDRRASVSRETRETTVAISLDLDGEGTASIETGVGFFDHLLSSLAHHGLFDLEIRTRGDLGVDEHHSVEDTALVLGAAFAGGARRPSRHRPLRRRDRADGRVAGDRGRGYRREATPSSSCRSAASASGAAAPARRARDRGVRPDGRRDDPRPGSGRNDHLAEAAFKALGRPRAACEPDPRRRGVASTKGSLG
jgi:imidazoleglycerol-phosphate dehydratase